MRYYTIEGSLPGPSARGRAAAYDDEYLARLRLVPRLVEQHVPLARVRDRLSHCQPPKTNPCGAPSKIERCRKLARVHAVPSPVVVLFELALSAF